MESGADSIYRSGLLSADSDWLLLYFVLLFPFHFSLLIFCPSLPYTLFVFWKQSNRIKVWWYSGCQLWKQTILYIYSLMRKDLESCSILLFLYNSLFSCHFWFIRSCSIYRMCVWMDWFSVHVPHNLILTLS